MSGVWCKGNFQILALFLSEICKINMFKHVLPINHISSRFKSINIVSVSICFKYSSSTSVPSFSKTNFIWLDSSLLILNFSMPAKKNAIFYESCDYNVKWDNRSIFWPSIPPSFNKISLKKLVWKRNMKSNKN